MVAGQFKGISSWSAGLFGGRYRGDGTSQAQRIDRIKITSDYAVKFGGYFIWTDCPTYPDTSLSARLQYGGIVARFQLCVTRRIASTALERIITTIYARLFFGDAVVKRALVFDDGARGSFLNGDEML